MDIIRNNSIFLSVHPEDSSEYTNAIMGEEFVMLKFRSRQALIFLYNDKIIFDEKEFLLKSPCSFKNLIQGWYEYELRFEASYYSLKECAFLNFDSNSSVPPHGDFNITSEPMTMLRLLVNNLNRNSSGWTLGSVSKAGAVAIYFSNQNCHDALQSMAGAFNLEYKIEGKTIHFGKVESANELLLLAKGQGKGLTQIEGSSLQSRENLATRLFPYGSDRNMKNGIRLKLSGVEYVEKNTDIFGIIERIQIYEDIFPRLVWHGEGTPGSVTSVSNNDGSRTYSFVDEFLDFDVNEHLAPGLTAKIVFATGELAGLTFDVLSFDNAEKRFVLKVNADNLPFEALVPIPGDEYYLSDITMPQSYIDIAQQELLYAATADIAVLSDLDVEFAIEPDNIYFKNNRILLQTGSRIELLDEAQGIDMIVRVFSFAKSLNYPYRYKNLSLKNTVNKSPLSNIYHNISENTREQSSLRTATTAASQSIEEKANEAIQTANRATDLATEANNSAFHAIVSANEAKSTAESAIQVANSAVQTAQNATDNVDELSFNMFDLMAKYNDLDQRIIALEGA